MGGDSNLENLQVLCKACNLAKGAKDPSKGVFLWGSDTPPAFSASISPKGTTTSVIYNDFGQIENE